jgi:hypothetical protein
MYIFCMKILHTEIGESALEIDVLRVTNPYLRTYLV